MFAAVMLMLAATPAPPGAHGAAVAQSPREQVQALLLKQAQAWNEGDLDAFCSVYVDDAVFISPTGVTSGRDQVLARYKKRYPDKAAMGALRFEFVDVRSEGAVASVAAKWVLTYPKKPQASGHTLLVLHRVGESWRIVQDASM